MRMACFLMTVSLAALLSGCATEAFVQDAISANNRAFVQEAMESHKDDLLRTLTPAVDKLVKQQAQLERAMSGLRADVSKTDAITKQAVADFQASLSEQEKLHASDMKSAQVQLTAFRQAFASQTKALDGSIETFRTEMNKQEKKTDEIVTGLERFIRNSVTEQKSVSDQQGKTLEKLVSDFEQQEKLLGKIRKASETRHQLLMQVFARQVKELQSALSSLEKTSTFTETPEEEASER